jgi:hypothetical protein
MAGFPHALYVMEDAVIGLTDRGGIEGLSTDGCPLDASPCVTNCCSRKDYIDKMIGSLAPQMPLPFKTMGNKLSHS